MRKSVIILAATLLCASCAVVPAKKLKSQRDIECGITTHEYRLKMVEMGHLSATCNTPECLVSIGVVAAITTGVTAVISGSIVVVGNMMHWIEQQGPCDKEVLERKVDKINQPLFNQGGKRVMIKDELKQELKDEW